MSYLIPKSFWSFPSMNMPSLLDEDTDWGMMTNMPSGISLSEDEKQVYVDAAIPGIDPKNVDITFERGVLRIVAESKHEEKEGRKYVRKSQRHFSYQVVLPETIDTAAEPEAKYSNGELNLTFAKSAKSQPKKITIKS